MGITAGAVGSFIGTPAEISLIRMTADGRYVMNRSTFYRLCLCASLQVFVTGLLSGTAVRVV